MRFSILSLSYIGNNNIILMVEIGVDDYKTHLRRFRLSGSRPGGG